MKDFTQILREYLTASVSGATATLDSTIDADDTTIALGSGEGASLQPIEGIFTIGIDSEFIRVTRSVDTLTVDAGGRGIMGTTAAAHTGGATVSVATLSDVVGSRVSGKPPRDNNSPSLWITYSEIPREDTGFFMLDALIRTFGGAGPKDSREIDCRTVHRLLVDRLNFVFNQATASGRIADALYESGGDVLVDPDTEWPFAQSRWNIEVA